MINVKNLDFSYKEKEIFYNLNFNIYPGKWISIIGDNGSGKSTLAKILIGLLFPSKGKILINNLELNEINLSNIRSLMGIVFQNPDYQFVGFDVKSDIAFGLENCSLSREQIQERINKYSNMFLVNELLDKKMQELSGGQKQKVAITSVLAMEPQIIIFDEPTAFLDPKETQEINNIIKNINQKKDKIIITITHDLSFALQSDEIIVLKQNKIWKYETSRNLLKNQDFLEEFFFSLPLALKVYYQLQKEKDLSSIDLPFFEELKDVLWQYNFEM
ncbi:ATP-binding cassette domain-containing protein [Candidatus Phytoplasma pini]|uniref:Cobalt transporter subunit, ATPase n=1 Tax=Candidatus Phytoplasma pini TaxID=267362 RepID=A0A559KJM3_9MOLU|nr:ATP-binding cassette domain-containing protein [Candidatus Phytoplasma pini]TVY12332.1 cobalt transporter subunit, ATPase [Candidatus Phytoplasma pini]